MKANISKGNSKLGNGIWNVNLPPIKSCRIDAPCKKECYAMKAYRLYPSVKKSWNNNLEFVKNNLPEYFNSIRQQLKHAKNPPQLFRWHSAGDILSELYFYEMVEIAIEFKDIKFLCFTKKYEIINEFMDNEGCKSLPENLSIIFSIWPGFKYDNPYCFPAAWFIDKDQAPPPSAIECFGSCINCGLCWSLKNFNRDVFFKKH